MAQNGFILFTLMRLACLKIGHGGDLSGYKVKSLTFCFDHSLALLEARLIWESGYDLRAIVRPVFHKQFVAYYTLICQLLTSFYNKNIYQSVSVY